MTINQFESLDNFSPDEHDLSGRLIREANILEIVKYELMERLDWAVNTAKLYYGVKDGAFVIHCITTGKHKENSYHYSGDAIDGHFQGLTLLQTYITLSRAGFTAIGIYPEWEHPGVHLDIRNQNHLSTWVGYYKENGVQDYRYELDYFIKTLEAA